MKPFLLSLAALATVLAATPASAQGWAMICTRDYNSSLNLRAGPNRNNYVVASVPNNAYVRTLSWVWGGDNQRWWRVESNGLIGWMRGDYLCR
jgi:hypothetical protein